MSASSVPAPCSNAAYACTRAQMEAGRGSREALRWVDPTLERRSYTYEELDRLSNRCAHVLAGVGAAPGETVFTFLPKCPELYFAFLGALKLGCVAGALFSNFGEEALLGRLGDAETRILVTRLAALPRLQALRPRLPSLRAILLVDAEEHQGTGVLSLPRLMEEAPYEFSIHPVTEDTPALLHYTSGSTGRPKGVLHRHGAVAIHRETSREVLGLGENDIYWCTADPGWVTGISYGLFGPWSLGVSQVHYGGGYDPERWMEVLVRERVSVWYTAPTAIRMLMQEEPQFFRSYDLSALRHVASVGEPLNPEAVRWVRKVLGHEVYDTWFQTETGGILISNRPGLEVRPGSMGKPVSGVEAAILDEAGEPLPPGQVGQLGIREGWGAQFLTYLNQEEAYRSRFQKGYYRTGDTAFMDEDGYFWFSGRSDDVINTAGHLVSPFEVESVLLERPEVAEAGVIAAPDEVLYEKVVAYVSLRPGVEWDRGLEMRLRLHVSSRVSAIAAPQEIRPLAILPRNRSGKVLRRVLRAMYQGTDPGDLSTREE